MLTQLNVMTFSLSSVCMIIMGLHDITRTAIDCSGVRAEVAGISCGIRYSASSDRLTGSADIGLDSCVQYLVSSTAGLMQSPARETPPSCIACQAKMQQVIVQ